MAGQTRIPWCDATWSPMTGCTPISEGCRNCYAQRMARRNLPNHSGPEPVFHPDRLDTPLHWRKPRRVFVCSMSDLMHDAFRASDIAKVICTMMDTPQHTYLVLTKRPKRLSGFIWPDNCWLGVTAENQQRADERIPILLDTPAAKRFVSIEPCLGPIDLLLEKRSDNRDLMRPLDWLILGGENGPGARPMQPEWALDVYRQCRAAGVAFFWKSWGSAFKRQADYGECEEMEQTQEWPS